MPEKLLTIKELAEYLDRPEKEIVTMVESGIIPAYKIGGSFLRFRKEQVDAIKDEIPVIRPVENPGLPKKIDTHTEERHTVTAADTKPSDMEFSFLDTVQDFFYFNDFYLVSFAIIGILLFIIFKM